MTIQASKRKHQLIALTVALISFGAVTSIFASCLAQPFFSVTPNEADKQMSVIAPLSAATIHYSLDDFNFTTYTYGGQPVQQTNQIQILLSFPDKTRQGQLSGSDALSLSTYLIQRMDFDAVFAAPKIRAHGFDEMVIFAVSDTATYTGTEFGIRLDLKDGCIYAYSQEPNGIPGKVNFQMLKLMPNDGSAHHYTLFMLGSKVAFYVDGENSGALNYPSKTDYSGYSFSILAVVHRFSDNWDSAGDLMTAENFSINEA